MHSSIKYLSDELTLDLGRRQLLRGIEPVAVSNLSFRLLCAFVEAAPNVVTHDQLAAKVWGPRRIVTPENLAKRVMILRRALEDDAQAPRYIAGIRGVGYRWIPEVRVAAEEPAAHVGSTVHAELAARAEPAAYASGPVHAFMHGRSVRYVLAALALAVAGLYASVSWLPEQPRGTLDIPMARPGPADDTDQVNAVRIDVEVVDTDTERVIRRDSYEAELTPADMLELQSEIARSIEEILGPLVVTRASEPNSDSVRDESALQSVLCTTPNDATFRDPITGERFIPMGSSLFPVPEPVTCLPVNP